MLAAESLRRQSCVRLRENQERQAYLVPAGKVLRRQKSVRIRGDQGRHAYLVSVVKNM